MESENIEVPICPECGSRHVIVAGRCLTCLECGFSRCSL